MAKYAKFSRSAQTLFHVVLMQLQLCFDKISPIIVMPVMMCLQEILLNFDLDVVRRMTPSNWIWFALLSVAGVRQKGLCRSRASSPHNVAGSTVSLVSLNATVFNVRSYGCATGNC